MSTQRSGWHQGKGNRRMPPRKSRGRGIRPEWKKQALHDVERNELTPPLSAVTHEGRRGETVGAAIYRFDQEAARLCFRYHVEAITGNYTYGYRFAILVSHSAAASTRQAAARLAPPPISHNWFLGRSGFWTELLGPSDKGY